MSNRKISSNKHVLRLVSGRSLLSVLRLHTWAGVVILVLAVFRAYLPSLSGEFILDDDAYLTKNQFIKASDGLYSFWCTTAAQDYYQISNTSLWLEWRP